MNNTKQDPAPTLVYILAASHSGSTLAAMLLNSHPKICTAGELKANNLGDTRLYRCSCQQLISECPFWKGVSAEMRLRGLEYDVRNAQTSLKDGRGPWVEKLLKPLHRGPALEWLRDFMLSLSPEWRSIYPVWAKRNRELISSVSKIADVPFVADSSKIAIRLKYLRRVQGLRVKVLRLVRDGRAVALTYVDPHNFADAKNPQLRGGGGGEAASPHRELSMRDAAREWRRSNEEAEAAIRGLSSKDYLQITYENLCLRTAETMDRVFSFLEVEPSEAYREFRSAPHHIVGNGMRLDDSSEIIFDDRWRQQLSESDLATFEEVAGELNRQYGYE